MGLCYSIPFCHLFFWRKGRRRFCLLRLRSGKDTVIRIAGKHLFDVCLADECHSWTDAWCCQFAFIYQFVNVLARTSHRDGGFWKGKVFLALHINDRFNGIDEVTLLLLASLFRLGLALLWAILLHSASYNELFSAECALSGCLHFDAILMVLHSFCVSPPFCQSWCTMFNLCQLIPHRHDSRRYDCIFVFTCSLLSTLVNWVRKVTKKKLFTFSAVEIRCKFKRKIGNHQISDLKC